MFSTILVLFHGKRWISCHGRNHLHTPSEYSWTIFFVVTTTASTRCLVQNFQLICYLQRVNATSLYNDSGSSRCSKWPNDRMVAVVKHCWLLVQEDKANFRRKKNGGILCDNVIATFCAENLPPKIC